MRNAIRRPSTWLLILALILLAIGVLWLLPRLLQPPPSPESNIAQAGEATERDGGLSGGAENGSGPPAGSPSGESDSTQETEASQARSDTSDPAGAAEVVAAPGRILGQVVDAAGHGIAGCTVLALHAPDFGRPIDERFWWITHLPLDVADPVALGMETPASATTDETGAFVFEGFEPGRLRFAIRSQNHEPVDRDDLWLPAGGTLELAKIRVERATTLGGRILDPEGFPVAGAPIVRVDDFAQAGLPPLSAGAGVLLATTNARGSFMSAPVARGAWSYVVSGGSRFPDLLVAGDSERDGGEIEAMLGDDETIRGRVRSSSRFTQPMVVRALPAAPAGAGAASIPFECRSDARWAEVRANSEFEFGGLEPGVVYELRASQRERAWEVDSAWSPPLLAVAGEQRAELLWDPDASVTFKIVASGSRVPLGECRATITGFDPESVLVAALSEATLGLSTIEGLRPRRLTSFRGLQLEKPGYLACDRNLADLRPGRALAIGDIELTPLPAMLVRVVDELTRRPIEGAWVAAIETPIELEDRESASGAATDDDGEARIPSFAGSGSGIEVRAPGYAPARRTGPFGAGFGEPHLEIGLVRGATARILVVDSAGDPVSAARIEHVEGNWSPNESWRDGEAPGIGERPDPRVSKIADERGAVEFRHLAPGRHAFRLRRYGAYQDSEWTQRELAVGDALEIVLVSQAPSTLEVRVHDNGLVLAGTDAALLRNEEGSDPIALLDPRAPLPPCLHARLNDRGIASFANLQPGRFVLLVRVPGQGVRAFAEANLAEGGSRVEIDLARRSIVGTVSHAESGPVGGADIFLAPLDRSGNTYRLQQLGYLAGFESFGLGFEIQATSSDETGSFRILGVPTSARFFVSARSGAFWRRGTIPARLGADITEARADLELLPAGAIEVRLGEDSSIVPCVLAANARESRSYLWIAPRRTFSGSVEVLEGLLPGEWDVVLGTAGGGRVRESIEVVAGETSFADLPLH
ncbi:MAG: hypothetical protein ACKVXR_15835 [Planctomycetota bacterium]